VRNKLQAFTGGLAKGVEIRPFEEKQSLVSEPSIGRPAPVKAEVAEKVPAAAEAERTATPRTRVRWWRDALRRRLLAAADLTAAVLAIAVAAPSLAPGIWLLAAAPLAILVAKLLGLYDRDHRAIRHLTIDETPAIAVWAAIVVAGIALLSPLLPDEHPSTTELLAAGVVAGLASLLLRSLARGVWRMATSPERTVVVGEGDLALGISRKIRLFSDMHLSLPDEDPIPVEALEQDTGAAGRLAAGFDRVVVASTAIRQSTIGDLVSACRGHQAKLSVVSPLRGRAMPALRISQVAELPVFEFNTWDPPRSTLLIKRTFDLVVSALALLILLPFLPLVAIAIRLDSRGPIFFTQTRAGENGEPFRMYKLRTMTADAEERLGEVVRLEELTEPMFKVNGDPRITRVGRVLRRFSIDELPQLFNVLLGRMSIVGPRPEEMAVATMYGPEHRFRLTVKPGLTGPMQVYGRGELTFGERLAVELEYIENLSIARDIRILLLTIPAAMRGTGAF
jgi:exopolysaccharide biosynthesis polyprenyl glycosylphosphotransferase